MRLLRLPARRRGLSCREVVELVTDYLEGAMPAAQRRRFESHLAACPDCTIYVDQLRALHDRLGRLEPADLSASAERELRRAFSAWRGG
jgi:anti-sigma factor RsiW